MCEQRGWRGMAFMAAIFVSALSVESLRAEPPVISGYINTTYTYNFMKPKSGMTALRSYDAKDNNIALNSAHLAFMGDMGVTGYVVEVDMGSDAMLNTPVGSGAADDFDLQEAYLTYKPNKFGLKVGKFVTFNGIEVIESKDNPTISRGFLYGLAEPFTHVGGLVTYAFSDTLDVAAGVVNGWDITTDNNDSKTAVGKIGLSFGDPLSLTISGYHGSEQANVLDDPSTVGVDESVDNDGHNRSNIDITGVTKIIPKVALWFQANSGQEERVVDLNGDGIMELATWSGFTVQPVVEITDKFSIGARAEYFDDDKGARTGTVDLAARNFTIAPAYKLSDNSTVRVEYRHDSANKKVWQNDKGVAKDSNSTGSVEFIVTF